MLLIFFSQVYYNVESMWVFMAFTNLTHLSFFLLQSRNVGSQAVWVHEAGSSSSENTKEYASPQSTRVLFTTTSSCNHTADRLKGNVCSERIQIQKGNRSSCPHPSTRFSIKLLFKFQNFYTTCFLVQLPLFHSFNDYLIHMIFWNTGSMALPPRLLTLQESARCCSYLPVCVETKACEKRAQKAQDGIYISYPLQSFNFLYYGTKHHLCVPWQSAGRKRNRGP